MQKEVSQLNIRLQDELGIEVGIKRMKRSGVINNMAASLCLPRCLRCSSSSLFVLLFIRSKCVFQAYLSS